MKRSVTRRSVSTRRATLPCVSVACNSSSRFRGAAFELMSGSIFVPENRPAAISSSPKQKWLSSNAMATADLEDVEHGSATRVQKWRHRHAHRFARMKTEGHKSKRQSV